MSKDRMLLLPIISSCVIHTLMYGLGTFLYV
jgi:hypothetical protein